MSEVEQQPTETEAWTWIYAGDGWTAVCKRCGALVAEEMKATHERWHLFTS